MDWSGVEVLRGTGDELASSVVRFVESANPEMAAELWWGLEGVAFSQNTIYGGAEPVMKVMMTAMAEHPPIFMRGWLVEVIRFILNSGSQTDSTLADRCREATSPGRLLLASEAINAPDVGYRGAVLEVLQVIDPTMTAIIKEALAEKGDDGVAAF
jgi:hypothetical protein